jgi:hypothetical protein
MHGAGSSKAMAPLAAAVVAGPMSPPSRPEVLTTAVKTCGTLRYELSTFVSSQQGRVLAHGSCACVVWCVHGCFSRPGVRFKPGPCPAEQAAGCWLGKLASSSWCVDGGPADSSSGADPARSVVKPTRGVLCAQARRTDTCASRAIQRGRPPYWPSLGIAHL